MSILSINRGILSQFSDSRYSLRLLFLSNVWEPYQSSQRKNLRNLRKPLDMLLFLSQ